MSALLLPGIQSQIGPLQRIIAAEYAGQEASGPMLRTWGNAGPVEIPAFNGPESTADGPGGLSARVAVGSDGQLFRASTTLFDLHSGPVEVWARINSTSVVASLGVYDDGGASEWGQWLFAPHSGSVRFYYKDESGDISRADFDGVSYTSWQRYYVEHSGGILRRRIGSTEMTSVTDLAPATSATLGSQPGASNTTTVRVAIVRKYTRPLTASEHAHMLANPTMARNLRGANP